jgi:uncharacterized damage-inducible protein DinB
METATAKTYNLAQALIGELTQEAKTTRTVLERVPTEKFDYKPHEKSMTFSRLATHVAEMVDWVSVTCNTSELDFAAGDYTPFEAKDNAELLEYFDKNVANAIESLKKTSDEAMMETWTMKNGEQIYFAMPKIQTLRGMVFNHILHHRGQLSVYLRLNDIPVPSIYGPSADEGQIFRGEQQFAHLFFV